MNTHHGENQRDHTNIDDLLTGTLSEADNRRLAEAMERFLAELEAGGRPDRQGLLAEYPELADQLVGYLDGLEFVYQVSPQLNSGVDAADKSPEGIRPLAVLGDYRIVREIGRGGMGVVYAAEQLSLGRTVALKVLPFAAMLDRRQLQRFKNEARAAATLKHPGIVDVHTVGCERGVHYFAMELIEGQSLAEVINDLREFHSRDHAADGRRVELDATDKRTLSGQLEASRAAETVEARQAEISTHKSIRSTQFVRAAVDLAMQASHALEHAHQSGVVHRDIKPGNLLVDFAGNLRITDFGLARIETDTGVTMTGDIIGTLRYMSPEQAAANRAVLDHRSDIYSLGVTLYELLTLEPAFRGDDREELLTRIIHDEPRPPRRLNPSIAADLETIILKSVAKEPADRYDSARQLAEDLNRFLQGLAIRAQPPTWLERMTKWTVRHKGWVAASLILMAVTTSGLALGVLLIAREQSQTQAAYESETRQRKRAEQNLHLALDALDKVYLEVAEQRLPQQTELTQEDREFLESALGFYEEFTAQNESDPALALETARAHRRVGTIQWKLGNLAAARESFQRALRMASAVRDSALDDAWLRLQAEIRHELGKVYRGSGKLVDAETHFREAVRLGGPEAWSGPDDIESRSAYVRYLGSLADVLDDTRGFEAADQIYKQALDVADRLVARDKPDPKDQDNLAALHLNRGQLWWQQQRFAEAEASLLRALEIQQELVRHQAEARYQTKLVMVHNGLGILMLNSQRNAEAESHFRQAVDLQRSVAAKYPQVPEQQSAVGACLSNLAMVLNNQNRHDDAVDMLREAVEFQAGAVAVTPLRTRYREFLIKHYINLAASLRALDQFDEAIQASRDALVAAREINRLWPENTDYQKLLAGALNELARSLSAASQSPATIEPLREAIELLNALAQQAPDDTNLLEKRVVGYLNIAGALGDTGRHEEAAEALAAGAALAPQLLGARPDEVAVQVYAAKIDTRLGSVLRDLGRPADATAACLRARDMWRRLAEHADEIEEYHGLAGDAEHDLGHLFEDDAQYSAAIEAYQRSIQLFPGSGVDRCLAWLRLECPEETYQDMAWVLAAARDGLQDDADSAGWLTVLGVALYREGQYADAVATLEQARSLTPERKLDEGFSLLLLAMAHARLGDQDKASYWFELASDWIEDQDAKGRGVLRPRRDEAQTLLESLRSQD